MNENLLDTKDEYGYSDTTKVKEAFDKYENYEYLKFERIPEEDKPFKSPELCAYVKIYYLMERPTRFDVNAERDCIYLPQLQDLKQLTDEDVLYLVRCGIHLHDGDYLADFC